MKRTAKVAWIWIVLTVAMAVADAVSLGNPLIQSGGWLIGFGLGAVLTIWILTKSRRNALGLLFVFSGSFASLYNATWELIAVPEGEQSIYQGVSLFPFGVTAPVWAWYAMMAVGVVMLAIGNAILGFWGEATEELEQDHVVRIAKKRPEDP